MAAALLAVAALLLAVTLIAMCGEPAFSDLKPAPPVPGAWASKVAPLSIINAAVNSLLRSGIRKDHFRNFSVPLIDRGPTLSRPMRLQRSGQAPDHPIGPGLYQTYPWTILLGVSRSGIDNGIYGPGPVDNFTMPVLKPRVEVIPESNDEH